MKIINLNWEVMIDLPEGLRMCLSRVWEEKGKVGVYSDHQHVICFADMPVPPDPLKRGSDTLQPRDPAVQLFTQIGMIDFFDVEF